MSRSCNRVTNCLSLIAAFALVTALNARADEPKPPNARRPNIVILLADDKYGHAVPDASCARQNVGFQRGSHAFRPTANSGGFRPIQGN
jgi:hypothetical protein